MFVQSSDSDYCFHVFSLCLFFCCCGFRLQDAASAAERAGLGSSLTGSLSSATAAAALSASASSSLLQQQQAAADAQRKLKAAQVQLAAATERTQALEASLGRAQTAAAADKQVCVEVVV